MPDENLTEQEQRAIASLQRLAHPHTARRRRDA
jgi:hypothetical protein